MRSAVAVPFALACLVTLAPQATAATLGPGTLEVWPGLSITHAHESFPGALGGKQEFDVNAFVLDTRLGYCVSRLVEIEVGPVLGHSAFKAKDSALGISDSGAMTQVGGTGGITLNLSSQGPVVPYVRGEIGAVSNSGDFTSARSSTVYLPILGAGVRWIVGSAAAVDFGASYEHVTHAAGSDATLDEIAFGVGMSLIVARGK